MKLKHWVPLVGLGVALALGFGAISQQGGGGLPVGTAFSTQYKASSTAFGGAGPGTSGQVLTSNGAGMAPTFQAGGSVTPAALTRTSDTNVTLTLGGTPTTALLQAVSLTMGWSGQLAVDRGGTNLNAAAEDNVMVGNATTWQSKALTSCSAATSAVTYNTSTNTFGCNTLAAASTYVDPYTNAFFFDDFLTFNRSASGTTAAFGAGNWGIFAAGTGSIESTSLANHPGIIRLVTGTGSTDEAHAFMFGLPTGGAQTASGNLLHATNVARVDCGIYIPTLPSVAENFMTYCGVSQRMPYDPTATNDNRVMGIAWHDGSNVRWRLQSAVNGGSVTNTAASTGPSAATFYQITLNMTTAAVTMLVDGVQVATHSTQVPTGSMGFGSVGLIKQAGTTAREVQYDYYRFLQPITGSRFQ